MELNIDNVRSLYRLSHMSRYATWPRICSESVATHSFYVVLFTMMICDELRVASYIRLEAMEIAVVHDLPETIMNDVTYDAKQKIQGLSELLDEYSEKYMAENFPRQNQSMFGEKGKDRLLARSIAKLADVYSVIQYCDNEVQLGNKPFQILLDEARDRVAEMLKLIERRYDLPCQEIML